MPPSFPAKPCFRPFSALFAREEKSGRLSIGPAGKFKVFPEDVLIRGVGGLPQAGPVGDGRDPVAYEE